MVLLKAPAGFEDRVEREDQMLEIEFDAMAIGEGGRIDEQIDRADSDEMESFADLLDETKRKRR